MLVSDVVQMVGILHGGKEDGSEKEKTHDGLSELERVMRDIVGALRTRYNDC